MVRPFNAVVLASLALATLACEPRENPYDYKPKKTVDLHKVNNEVSSEEELAALRKASGIRSPEEIAAENAKFFEDEARGYIKARLPEYRKTLAELRGFLDQIEKQAPKWKNDAAFEKFHKKYKEQTKEFFTRYDELTGEGAEGGETQVDIGWAVRAWEQLNSDIGPGVAEHEGLPGALQEIRDRLDLVDIKLEQIEKDDTIEVPELEPAQDDKAKNKAK
jgi:hypothetical protein